MGVKLALISLCITSRFEIFHSNVNYREQALTNRINELNFIAGLNTHFLKLM